MLNVYFLHYPLFRAFKNNKQCGRRVRPTRYAPARLTLIFDRLTLKLVCESHLTWDPSFKILAR